MTQEQLDLYIKNITREATIIKKELKAMKTKQDLLQVGQRVNVLNLSVLTLMDIQRKDWEETMNPHLVENDFNPEYDITNEV